MFQTLPAEMSFRTKLAWRSRRSSVSDSTGRDVLPDKPRRNTSGKREKVSDSTGRDVLPDRYVLNIQALDVFQTLPAEMSFRTVNK